MRTLSRALPVTIAAALAACTAGVESAGDCARTLSPGDSVAGALSSLGEGETLCLSAGRFELDAPLELLGARDVTIAGVEVAYDEDAEDPLAEAGTVLDFAGAEGAGAALSIGNSSGVTIRDLTIESPPATGVAVVGSSEVTLRRVTVVQADPEARRTEDGIRVSEAARVRIDEAQLLGGSGAGVSLSGCTECVVERSVVLEHLAGVLVTESERCEVRESEIEVNGIGVVVADLPSDPRATRSIVVRNSLVLDSGLFDHPAPAEAPWPHLPQGTGVLVLSADDVELSGNAIEGNRAAGVLLLSWSTLVATAGAPEAPAGHDGDPALFHAHDDTFLENGFDPSGQALSGLLERVVLEELADLVWDGAGDPASICLRPSPDSASTFLDLDARGGFTTVSSELSPHECEHPGHGLVLP